MTIGERLISIMKNDGVSFGNTNGAEHSCHCFLPEHEDSKESMCVNVEKAVWYCHRCDVGDDALGYLTKYRGQVSPDLPNLTIAAAKRMLSGGDLQKRKPKKKDTHVQTEVTGQSLVLHPVPLQREMVINNTPCRLVREHIYRDRDGNAVCHILRYEEFPESVYGDAAVKKHLEYHRRKAFREWYGRDMWDKCEWYKGPYTGFPPVSTAKRAKHIRARTPCKDKSPDSKNPSELFWPVWAHSEKLPDNARVDKLPWYGLCELIADMKNLPHSPVFVFEGELCVDLVRQLQLGKRPPVTTLPLGAKKTDGKRDLRLFKNIDLEPLRGRRLVLVADRDETGRMFMRAVGRHLTENYDCRVTLALPEGEDGFDVADILREHSPLADAEIAHKKLYEYITGLPMERVEPACDTPAEEHRQITQSEVPPAPGTTSEDVMTQKEQMQNHEQGQGQKEYTKGQDPLADFVHENSCFMVLGFGYSDGRKKILIHKSADADILKLSDSSLDNAFTLSGLAPTEEWNQALGFARDKEDTLLARKNRLAIYEALDQEATMCGRYDSMTRHYGLGAFRTEPIGVGFNTGTHVIINRGEQTSDAEIIPIKDLPNHKKYPTHKILGGKPPYSLITHPDGGALWREFSHIVLSHPSLSMGDKKKLVGWLLIAVVGGALPHRPCLWITGERGKGKTTVFEMTAKNLFGEDFYADFEDKTGPGIIQRAKSDAKPIFIDELQATSRADSRKYEAITKVIKDAFSYEKTRGSFLKSDLPPTIRFIPCAASVGLPDLDASEMERTVIIEHKSSSDEAFHEYEAKIAAFFDPKRYDGKLKDIMFNHLAFRTEHIVGKFLERAKTPDMLKRFPSARRRIIFAELETGVEELTGEPVKLTDDVDQEDSNEESQFGLLNQLLSTPIRVEYDDCKKDTMWDAVHKRKEGKELAQMYGLRIEEGASQALLIAHTHPGLKQLARTVGVFETKISKAIRNIPGAISPQSGSGGDAHRRKFGKKDYRCVRIPKEVLESAGYDWSAFSDEDSMITDVTRRREAMENSYGNSHGDGGSGGR